MNSVQIFPQGAECHLIQRVISLHFCHISGLTRAMEHSVVCVVYCTCDDVCPPSTEQTVLKFIAERLLVQPHPVSSPQLQQTVLNTMRMIRGYKESLQIFVVSVYHLCYLMGHFALVAVSTLCVILSLRQKSADNYGQRIRLLVSCVNFEYSPVTIQTK